MNNQAQLTLAQIFGALSRHRYKALLTWSLVMVTVVAAFILMPRKYGSQGQLYIQMGRNQTSISPSTGSASISIQDTRETEIRSVVEIIRSRGVLEKVVDDVGADEILASPFDAWIPKLALPSVGSRETGGDGMSTEEYDRLRKRELATKALQSSLDVNAEKKTSVVSVYLKANSPQLAQTLVNKVVEHARTIHLQIHAAAGSAIFFDDQFDKQEEALNAATKKLAEFRNARKILSLDSERSSLQTIISGLENDIVYAEIETDQNSEGLRKLQTLIAKTEALIAIPTTGRERLSYEDSRTSVFQLETERARMVATYSAIHPRVQTIDQQLAEAKQKLSLMTDNRTESAMVSNPIFEATQVDLIRAESEYAANLARLKSLKCKKDEGVEKLTDLNDAEIVAGQLKRDVSVASQYLANYTQKRGEAMAMAMLDQKKISDIVISQDASLQLKHVSPRGSLFLPFGFIVGVLAALGVALFCERNRLSPSLNESDVEQILGLPVLVTLPRVYSSRNMVN